LPRKAVLLWHPGHIARERQAAMGRLLPGDAEPGSQRGQQQGQAAGGSHPATDNPSRHPATARHGDNCIPRRGHVPVPGAPGKRALLPGKPLTQKNPPRVRPRHPRSLQQLGVPERTASGAAGVRYLSVCRSWRTAAAHPPWAGVGVPRGAGGCCSLMPSVRRSARPCGGAGRAPPGQQSPPTLPLPAG